MFVLARFVLAVWSLMAIRLCHWYHVPNNLSWPSQIRRGTVVAWSNFPLIYFSLKASPYLINKGLNLSLISLPQLHYPPIHVFQFLFSFASIIAQSNRREKHILTCCYTCGSGLKFHGIWESVTSSTCQRSESERLITSSFSATYSCHWSSYRRRCSCSWHTFLHHIL